MTEPRTMLSLAEDYLTERRALGFDLRIPGDQIAAFARFVDEAGHSGPLTTRIILDWVQGQAKHAKPFSWARRLDALRPFARYLTRLDPATEFPQTAIFGRSHRRLAPHIYSEQEICDLLAAARRLAPHGGLRPATYETIFGLIAATGLRLSEALHLRCGDVDLDQGVLTVRNTKFRKSRHVPMHPTVVAALNRYMVVRARHGATNRDSLLFLSSSGGLLPKRTIHGVFQQLRGELGWTARGAYLSVLWRRHAVTRTSPAPRSTEHAQLVRYLMRRRRSVAIIRTRTAALDRSIDACSGARPTIVLRLVCPLPSLLSKHLPPSSERQRQTLPGRHHRAPSRSSAIAAAISTQSP